MYALYMCYIYILACLDTSSLYFGSCGVPYLHGLFSLLWCRFAKKQNKKKMITFRFEFFQLTIPKSKWFRFGNHQNNDS